MGLTRVGVEWILSPVSLSNYFLLMAKNHLPYPIFLRINLDVILDKIIVQNFTNFLVFSRRHKHDELKCRYAKLVSQKSRKKLQK